MAYHVRTDRPTGKAKPTFQFNVRAPSHHLHERLRAAAIEDGTTQADLISSLLDLREYWQTMTTAGHPLAVPHPVPRPNIVAVDDVRHNKPGHPRTTTVYIEERTPHGAQAS
jgi:hypothetical protein